MCLTSLLVSKPVCSHQLAQYRHSPAQVPSLLVSTCTEHRCTGVQSKGPRPEGRAAGALVRRARRGSTGPARGDPPRTTGHRIVPAKLPTPGRSFTPRTSIGPFGARPGPLWAIPVASTRAARPRRRTQREPPPPPPFLPGNPGLASHSESASHWHSESASHSESARHSESESLSDSLRDRAVRRAARLPHGPPPLRRTATALRALGSARRGASQLRFA